MVLGKWYQRSFCWWRTGVNRNTMDFITIATTGNAIDFGDLGTKITLQVVPMVTEGYNHVKT